MANLCKSASRRTLNMKYLEVQAAPVRFFKSQREACSIRELVNEIETPPSAPITHISRLTHLGQPLMVPSPTPDDPPWSPHAHSPQTTPHGPLTHVGLG